MTKYNQWRTDINTHVINKLNISNGDAQGFIDVHTFKLAQAWTKGLSAINTAKTLLNADLQRLQNKFSGATHAEYWDCDCESNYIHPISESTHCTICNANPDMNPSSMVAECVLFGFVSESDQCHGEYNESI